MNGLLPSEVLALCETEERRRAFEAAALFLDISGFTPLTGALMRLGKSGAESLAEVLNGVFRPVIAAVYARGGYVSGFAGDAFTALFPAAPASGGREPALRAAAEAALAAAEEIRSAFAGSVARTPAGDFPLAARIGLAAGAVELGLAGDDARAGGRTRRAYYFRGPAVDACAAAEQRCEKGALALDPGLEALLGTAPRAAARVGGKGPAFPELDAARAAAFYPLELLEAEAAGEFRRLACLFVSFRDLEGGELDAFAADLLREVDAREGYFNRLDFGDKGGNALAFFGAPSAHEDDLDRALQCALALRRAHGGRVRCGITEGTMYFGRVGIPERCEFTALGDAVNLAARLMMRADWGAILVPAPVAARPSYAFSPLGDLAFKGLSSPVPTWSLERRREAREAFFAEAMVGREAEYRELAEWAAPVAAGGGPRAALIYGEAGMGKSRLAFALRQALGDRVRWLTAQADPILRQAFNPFAYLLSGFFGQSPDARAAENLARFESAHRALLGASLPPALAAELRRTKSFLGALLGLSWPDSPYERLADPKLRYENTLAALTAFLRAAGRARPAVVELEDAQVLDDASRDLLARLAGSEDAGSLLLLVTSRYADDGSKPGLDLSGPWPAKSLELGRLAPGALAALAEGLLGGPADRELSAFLESRSEGVPFYAQQTLLYLREAGSIEDSGGAWRLRAEPGTIPESLNAILVARLDRLGSEVRRAVQTAAVIGQEFDIRLLSCMLRGDASQEARAAERGQIWSALSEIQYIFKHALLREAAYDMQLRARLRDLHALAVEAYEQIYAQDLRPRSAELAYHAERAGLPGKQRLYYALAAEVAAAEYRNAAAFDLLSKLLPLLEGGRERREALLKRGDSLEVLGRWDEAEADYRAALALAGAPDGAAAAGRGRRMMGRLCRFRGDFEEALRWLSLALDSFRAAGDRLGLAAALVESGAVRWQKGDYPDARRDMEEGLGIARELGDLPTVALALNGLGNVSCNMGDLASAQALYGEALGIRRGIGDKRGAAALLNNLGALADYRGDFDAERGLFEECLATMREIGDRNGVATGLCNLGTVLWSQGDCAAARERLGEALAIAREMGNKQGIMTALGNLGGVAAQLGDFAGARALHEECLALNRELGHKQGVANTLHNLGNVALMEGDFGRARGHYAESLSLGQAIGEKVLLAHDFYALAAAAGMACSRAAGAPEAEGLARRAALLAAASERLIGETGAEIDPADVGRYSPWVDAARERLGEGEFLRAKAEGAGMGLEEAVRRAAE